MSHFCVSIIAELRVARHPDLTKLVVHCDCNSRKWLLAFAAALIKG
jgi:hypothetical protein